MKHLAKIVSREKVSEVLRASRAGKVVGLAGGVFDLIHVGHVRYLAEAKSFCDILIVAVNSDISVKKFKSSDRPVLGEKLRLELVASVMYVDYCFLFDEPNQFENLRLIKPDVFLKGGDYSFQELVKIDNLNLLDKMPEVKIISLVEGISTSSVIQHIRSNSDKPINV
ncbi:MAG: adenylyltransferase/cytidyltransferase family protein [Deltaproteobacteria bacterium]|nr:adenylyltransferase/cytidyltransferase family protein [Deltaproteobacteria bacterium]